MVSIPKEDILALIGKYLVGIGEERLAKKIFKLSGSSQQAVKTHPLLKKKLQKIIKHYANDHPYKLVKCRKIYNYYAQGQQKEEDVDSADERPVLKESHPHKKVKLQEEDPNYAGTVLKGFSKPKLLETTVIDKLEVVEFHPDETSPKRSKKAKKQKHIQEEDQEDQNGKAPEQQVDEEMSPMELSPTKRVQSDEEDEEEEKVVKKYKRAPPKREPLKCQIKPFTPPSQPQENPSSEPNHKKFFSRINKDEIGDLPDELRDNSFQAKFKFGSGDEWGRYGYEKLKDTRGDGFKKQKGKLKNKAFQASGIDMYKINSIQLS